MHIKPNDHKVKYLAYLLFAVTLSLLTTATSCVGFSFTDYEEVIIAFGGEKGATVKYDIEVVKKEETNPAPNSDEQARIDYQNERMKNAPMNDTITIPDSIKLTVKKSDYIYLKINTKELGEDVQIETYRNKYGGIELNAVRNDIVGYQIMQL